MPDAGLPYRLAQRGKALLAIADKQRPDDRPTRVPDGPVGGNVPRIDDKGVAIVGFAPQHCGDDGVLRAAGTKGRDKRADGPASVSGLDSGGDAQNVALRVDALEDGHGAAGQAADIVYERRLAIPTHIRAQPDASDHHARQSQPGPPGR